MSHSLQDDRRSKAWRFVRRHWTWLLVAALAVFAYRRVSPPPTLPETGRPAPELVLETMEGEPFSLRALRGEVVVLNVWATWCAPCRVELPGFVALQEELADEGVRFVGLSVDAEGFEVVRPFAREHGLNYVQLASREAAARHFPGNAVPRTYLIDRQGRIRYEHTGVLVKWTLRPKLLELARE